jgi:hypothetical protein
VRHGRYVSFQMAEVAIPRDLFADILHRIAWLRPKPDPARRPERRSTVKPPASLRPAFA